MPPEANHATHPPISSQLTKKRYLPHYFHISLLYFLFFFFLFLSSFSHFNHRWKRYQNFLEYFTKFPWANFWILWNFLFFCCCQNTVQILVITSIFFQTTTPICQGIYKVAISLTVAGLARHQLVSIDCVRRWTISRALILDISSISN